MNRTDLAPSRSIEKAVLGAGIFLLLVPGAILFTNLRLVDTLFQSSDVLSLSPIGEIKRPERIVRRRGEDQLAFLTVRSGEPIFVGDTILTGKDSSTRIHLSDGSVLQVGPESMIKIDPVRNFSFKGIKKKFNVTIQAGEIKAKKEADSPPIVFKSLSGSVLQELSSPAAPEEATPMEFTVVSAPETLPNPASVPVAAPEVANQAPASPAELPPLTPELITAPGTGRMITDFLSKLEPEAVEIKKQETSPSQEDQPLLSKFSAPIQEVPDIEVDPLPPTSILSDDADLKDLKFHFKWKDAGFRVKLPYVLKIQHKGNLLEFQTPGLEYDWPLPLEADGTIKWWVTATLADGSSIESKKQDSSWRLPKPILASPGNNLELPEFYLKGESHEVLLTWKQMKVCTGYEVNVSKSEDFKVLEFKASTRKNFHTFPVAKPGRYFWRVGCAYSKDFSAFSNPFSFKLSKLN